MNPAELFQAVIALLFVLALILLIAWAVKRYGVDKNWQLKSADKRRLEVIERLVIDPKRQLVLVRRDHKEHLLAIGQNEVHVVESYDASNAKE
jgi:flagellar protein FliO/FliZ